MRHHIPPPSPTNGNGHIEAISRGPEKNHRSGEERRGFEDNQDNHQLWEP